MPFLMLQVIYIFVFQLCHVVVALFFFIISIPYLKGTVSKLGNILFRFSLSFFQKVLCLTVQLWVCMVIAGHAHVTRYVRALQSPLLDIALA